jgi:predicted XRE-type DNA-binding protein
VISLRTQLLTVYNPNNFIGEFTIMARPKSDAKARFMSFVKVADSGCWEWSSTLSNGGYGKFYFEGKQSFAHRACYTIFKGEIPKGLFVLHKCDNRKCVNLDHLYLGSAKDNTADKLARCVWHGNMKHTASVIAQCKKLYVEGNTQQQIARKLGVSQPCVSRFVRGKYLSRKGTYYA